MMEGPWFLMQYVDVVGGPMWSGETDGAAFVPGTGWRGQLTRPNRGDERKRLRVYVVPADRANDPLDSLIRAALDGALQKIFEDRAQLQKWGIAP